MRIGDLDLSTPSGVATLETRLRAAAGKACRLATRSMYLDRRDTEARCIRDSLAEVASQVDRLSANAVTPRSAK